MPSTHDPPARTNTGYILRNAPVTPPQHCNHYGPALFLLRPECADDEHRHEQHHVDIPLLKPKHEWRGAKKRGRQEGAGKGFWSQQIDHRGHPEAGLRRADDGGGDVLDVEKTKEQEGPRIGIVRVGVGEQVQALPCLMQMPQRDREIVVERPPRRPTPRLGPSPQIDVGCDLVKNLARPESKTCGDERPKPGAKHQPALPQVNAGSRGCAGWRMAALAGLRIQNGGGRRRLRPGIPRKQRTGIVWLLTMSALRLGMKRRMICSAWSRPNWNGRWQRPKWRPQNRGGRVALLRSIRLQGSRTGSCAVWSDPRARGRGEW